MNLNSIIHGDNAANIQVVVSAKDLRDCFESWMEFMMKTLKEHDEPTFYTRDELAQMLHVSAPTILSYRKRGLLPEPCTIDGRVLYDKAKVREALESVKMKRLLNRKRREV